VDDSLVTAANRLTGRWAATCDDQATVLSATGLLPILLLLASVATGRVRAELLEAVGVPRADLDTAIELLMLAGRTEAVRAAVAVWAQRDVPLTDWFTDRVPRPLRQTLTGDAARDQVALDAWARRATDGLIDAMPPADGAVLALTTALAVRTAWEEPFDEAASAIATGPWARRGPVPGLLRSTVDVDAVAVWQTPSGPITSFSVAGAGDVDVYLVLGAEGARAGQVLSAAIGAVTEGAPMVRGSALPPGRPGPGLLVGAATSIQPDQRLRVRCVEFAVAASHDLLARADLFGLATATATAGVHFPRMSPQPLALGAAQQSAMAQFTATGFTAAAVTGAYFPVTAARPVIAQPVTLTYDRPFGFVTVRRSLRLALFAGWVTQPRVPMH